MVGKKVLEWLGRKFWNGWEGSFGMVGKEVLEWLGRKFWNGWEGSFQWIGRKFGMDGKGVYVLGRGFPVTWGDCGNGLRGYMGERVVGGKDGI